MEMCRVPEKVPDSVVKFLQRENVFREAYSRIIVVHRRQKKHTEKNCLEFDVIFLFTCGETLVVLLYGSSANAWIKHVLVLISPSE